MSVMQNLYEREEVKYYLSQGEKLLNFDNQSHITNPTNLDYLIQLEMLKNYLPILEKKPFMNFMDQHKKIKNVLLSIMEKSDNRVDKWIRPQYAMDTLIPILETGRNTIMEKVNDFKKICQLVINNDNCALLSTQNLFLNSEKILNNQVPIPSILKTLTEDIKNVKNSSQYTTSPDIQLVIQSIDSSLKKIQTAWQTVEKFKKLTIEASEPLSYRINQYYGYNIEAEITQQVKEKLGIIPNNKVLLLREKYSAKLDSKIINSPNNP